MKKVNKGIVLLFTVFILGNICAYGSTDLPIEVNIWASQTYDRDYHWNDVYSFGGVDLSVPGVFSGIGIDWLSFDLCWQENVFYNTIGVSNYTYKITDVIELGLKLEFDKLTFGVGHVIVKNDQDIYYVDKEQYTKMHCWIEVYHREADAILSVCFSPDNLNRYKIFRVPSQYDELKFKINWYGCSIGLSGLIHAKASAFTIRKTSELELSISPACLWFKEDSIRIRLYGSWRCSELIGISYEPSIPLWYHGKIGLKLYIPRIETYVEYDKDFGDLGYMPKYNDRIAWGFRVTINN
jgi:hypothetical protein